MNKKVAKAVTGVLNRNIAKEADNRCLVFGYQPKMPERAKDFASKKTK